MYCEFAIYKTHVLYIYICAIIYMQLYTTYKYAVLHLPFYNIIFMVIFPHQNIICNTTPLDYL